MDFSIVEKNLKDRGYIVTIFETATEAVKYLDMHIDNQTVGFGGSVTLEQMKLFETLQMVLSSWRLGLFVCFLTGFKQGVLR